MQKFSKFIIIINKQFICENNILLFKKLVWTGGVGGSAPPRLRFHTM